MWIKKFHKDDSEDLRSPIPTQVVSNEEYLPRPQTPDQKKSKPSFMKWQRHMVKKQAYPEETS